MARQKRTSAALIKAEQRAAGMRSIDPNLDLGNGLTLANYTRKIENLRSHLSTYATLLAQTDELSRKITLLEAELNRTSEQMLLSIGGKYGKDSSEYGQAGGSRRGERRRKATAANVPSESTTKSETIPLDLMNGKNTARMNGNSKTSIL
jgi:hypothetical protein